MRINMTKEELVKFLKENMTIEVEGRPFSSSVIVIKIDKEVICEGSISVSDLKEYDDW